MLKIERTAETGSRVTYALSGKMTGAHVAELARLVEAARAAGRQITFDLEGVGLVDRSASAFFHSGAGARARLLHCPAFLEEWLREASAAE